MAVDGAIFVLLDGANLLPEVHGLHGLWIIIFCFDYMEDFIVWLV